MMIAPNNGKPTGPKLNGNEPSANLVAIGETLKPLQELCRDRKDAPALRRFAELLADLPPAALERAVLRYVNETEELWFPSPGILRRLAAESIDGELPEWHHAWDRIMHARQIWDRYDRKRAIAAREYLGERLYRFVQTMLGGFIALSCADSPTLSVLQSNFRQAFTTEKKRATRDRALPAPLRPRSITGPGELENLTRRIILKN